jgi:NMD protein affecting ribosome stability and mRNA decay
MKKTAYGRKDRLLKEKRHDSYMSQTKLPEPTVCNKCGVVFTNGRWTWKEPSEQANKIVCPACRRQADNYPAGNIKLSGLFYQEHKQEILNLIQNVEKQEKQEHPLERIMTIEGDRSMTIITTTGIHIARRIGEALSRAYKGDYKLNYANGDEQIQVSWHR